MRTKLDAVSLAAVLVTVIAFSATAPLTAYATGPVLALALGRNALGLLTLGPVLTLIRRREMRKVFRGERLLLKHGEQRRAALFGVLAGTALAAHFVTFMSSTRLTSVALATALVATQPVWQALITTLQGNRLRGTTWAGLIVAVLGAVVASGADGQAGGDALLGDLLALAGAIALAGYTALSEKARPAISTPTYSVLCSAVCTVELLLLCLFTGTPVFMFDGDTWLALLGLLLLPQLLGLFSLNFALGRAPATEVSVLLLLEAPVAAVIAWLWLDQLPAGSTWPGLTMIMLGVAWVVLADTRRTVPRGGVTRARGVPAPLSPYPPPVRGRVLGGDTQAQVFRHAYAGRLAEAEATIRRLENQAVRVHGVKSSEATRWIEVRAAVARIAGDHGLAAMLWLTAARLHSTPPHADPSTAVICLDRAFQDWDATGDVQVVDALAPQFRELYAQYPGHRPDADAAVDRRLRRVASLTDSVRVPLHDIRGRTQ